MDPLAEGPAAPIARRVRAALGGAAWPELVAAGGLATGLPRAPGEPASMATVVAVAAQLGRHPDPLPYQAQLVGPLLALSRADRPGELATGVATGVTRASLSDGGLRATPQAGGWALEGTSPLVPFADELDVLLVALPTPAAGPGTAALLAVPTSTPGVTRTPAGTVGEDRRADLHFHGTSAPDDALVGPLGGASDPLAWIEARRAVAAAAEMVGAAGAALERAVDHAGRRRQFGQPIGSFQAVAHRLADALIDLTVAADVVAEAAGRLDGGQEPGGAPPGVGALVGECCARVVAAAHQVVGGPGISAEDPLHRWFRRVHALAPALGDPARHRAALGGAVVAGAAGDGAGGPPGHLA